MDAKVGKVSISSNTVPVYYSTAANKTYFVTAVPVAPTSQEVTIEQGSHVMAGQWLGCGLGGIAVVAVNGRLPIVHVATAPQQRQKVWVSATEALPNRAGYGTQAEYLGDTSGIIFGPGLAIDPALASNWDGAGSFNASGALVAFMFTSVNTGQTEQAGHVPASPLSIIQFIQTGEPETLKALARYGTVVGFSRPAGLALATAVNVAVHGGASCR
jgi:hypothetical protein